MTATEPAATIDTWTAQLEQLRTRYKHVRPAVLAALNVLVHNENVLLDDAEAQAALHGVRITAASLGAARILLSRMDAAPTPSVASSASAPSHQPRRPHPAEKVVDAEAMVRAFVEKLQGQGDAEAERMRDAMRRAIAILNVAIGS